MHVGLVTYFFFLLCPFCENAIYFSALRQYSQTCDILTNFGYNISVAHVSEYQQPESVCYNAQKCIGFSVLDSSLFFFGWTPLPGNITTNWPEQHLEWKTSENTEDSTVNYALNRPTRIMANSVGGDGFLVVDGEHEQNVLGPNGAQQCVVCGSGDMVWWSVTLKEKIIVTHVEILPRTHARYAVEPMTAYLSDIEAYEEERSPVECGSINDTATTWVVLECPQPLRSGYVIIIKTMGSLYLCEVVVKSTIGIMLP